MEIDQLKKALFSDQIHFNKLKEQIFNYQSTYNLVFKEFINNSKNKEVYLPISAFKSSKIVSFAEDVIDYFESSGTTLQNTSRHYFKTKELYHHVSLKIFEDHFGPVKNKVIVALLPGYLERPHSSLVDMVKMLMDQSENIHNGFYLYNFDELHSKLIDLNKLHKEVILFGVSFALIDFIQHINQIEATHMTVIETGGMKGRKKEITRDELHDILKNGFKGATISSEYGMTELFSQAYLQEDGWFRPGYTMEVFTTEINDPYTKERFGKTGILNITDLANIDSCSFIATEDLGILREDGCFKVMGRLDNSDMRGCNLLIQ